MIKLYIRFTCPFCQKVMAKVEELNLKEKEDYEYIDSEEGTPGRKVVLEEGGKPQVPFMIDGDTKMYESADIISYISEKFTK